jgi:hypothetical protein
MGRPWAKQIVVCDGCGRDTPRRSKRQPFTCAECDKADRPRRTGNWVLRRGEWHEIRETIEALEDDDGE